MPTDPALRTLPSKPLEAVGGPPPSHDGGAAGPTESSSGLSCGSIGRSRAPGGQLGWWFRRLTGVRPARPAVEPVRLTPFFCAGWLGLWSGDQGPTAGGGVTGDAAAPLSPTPPPAAPAEQDRATKAIRRLPGGSPVPRPTGCHPGTRSSAAVVAREPRARHAAFRRGAPGAADRHRDQSLPTTARRGSYFPLPSS